MSHFLKNLNTTYTEESNREDGYWSDTSSSSDEDGSDASHMDVGQRSPGKKKNVGASPKAAVDGPAKGETYGQYTKRKAQEEWAWATNPQAAPVAVESRPKPEILSNLTAVSKDSPPPQEKALKEIPLSEKVMPTGTDRVRSGEFQRLLELLGSDDRRPVNREEVVEETTETPNSPITPATVSTQELASAVVATSGIQKVVPTANDIKYMREADSKRFEEQLASERRFSAAVDALESLVVSQSFVQAVYKFLRANHEAFLSTKLRREVGEFSHTDFDVYNKYVEKFEGTVLRTLAASCKDFDEEEFFEKLFEPRIALPGSEDARTDPLSFEGWEVLLSLLNFESFVDLMDDFIAATYGADELSGARSTKTAAKRGLPQKQTSLEVQGEAIEVKKTLTNLRSKPAAKRAPSSANSTLKPKRL